MRFAPPGSVDPEASVEETVPILGPPPGVPPGSTRVRSGFLRVVTWSFVAEAGGQVMTLVVGLALAALVGPEAYGVVAMATAFVLFIDLVQRQGIVSAIIQRRALDDHHLDAAFWMVLATSLAMTALSVALAGWWAAVVGEPLLAQAVVVLSALLPLKALTIVQEALLRRQMAFRKVALRTTGSVAVGGVAGLAVALIEPSVWAFVVQQLVTAAAGLVLLWMVARWRPRFRFSSRAARDLLGFSAGSFVSSLGVFANNRADVLTIGIFFGPIAVGVYAVCARVTESVSSFALRPMQSMALPELSPFQHRTDVFGERLSRLERTTAVIGLPVLGVGIVVAEPFLLVLGPSWASGTTALQVLFGVAAVRVVTGLNGPVLQALGRPFLQAAVTWVAGAGSILSVIIGAAVVHGRPLADQVTGIAAARLGFVLLVILPLHLGLMRRLLGRGVVVSLRPFALQAISLLAAVGAGTLVQGIPGIGGLAPWARLAVVAATAALVAVGALLCADGRVRRTMFARLPQKRPRRRVGRHRATADRLFPSSSRTR
jgi:O-antigen/teichoic acid export membrane protein